MSKMPDGYKVAFEYKSGNGSILELIPEGEMLSQWTEMLTVQILRNPNEWMLAEFQAGMAERWAEMCPCGSTEIIERGRERRQSVLIWSHICPLNKSTGQPEQTWLKALIRGGNIIVVQKAFRFAPSADVIDAWITFLREVRLNHRRSCRDTDRSSSHSTDSNDV